MDGLAATLALVACAYFAIDAVTEHSNDTVLVLALSLGLASAAFLPFNLRPQRGAAVFMGDSGMSQLLGFGSPRSRSPRADRRRNDRRDDLGSRSWYSRFRSSTRRSSPSPGSSRSVP